MEKHPQKTTPRFSQPKSTWNGLKEAQGAKDAKGCWWLGQCPGAGGGSVDLFWERFGGV